MCISGEFGVCLVTFEAWIPLSARVMGSARSWLRVAASALLLAVAVQSVNNNTVVFVEPDFLNATDPSLARISTVCQQHGGREFQVLSLMTWNGDFAPNETSPLPPPDNGTVTYLHAVKAQAAGPFKVWGGVSLCPGREYACMLNYTQSNITGTQLAQQVLFASLDGVMIYVSPYCNNANCQRTTGKYAIGIAAILTAFHAEAARLGAPNLQIALFANEWDHGEIIVTGQPAAVFSYQTVFYFTTITDCQQQCGAMCGAGENVAYIEKGGVNFTSVTTYMAQHNVAWIGQLRGASTNETSNPPDFWTALAAYVAA